MWLTGACEVADLYRVWFLLQAVGQLPPNNPIPWRGDALLYEKAPKLGFEDLTGGWLQGGVAGKPGILGPPFDG